MHAFRTGRQDALIPGETLIRLANGLDVLPAGNHVESALARRGRTSDARGCR